MNKKLNICFIWYFDKAGTVVENWRDGLRAAIEEIEKEHNVDWVIGKIIPKNVNKYDFILCWDDSNTEVPDKLKQQEYKGKIGICLTTDPHNIENLKNFNAIYCESIPVYEAVRSNGLRAIKAFGTDVNFFTPTRGILKDIFYFYPATFSPWKRQSEIAYLGKKLLCVGTLQPDGYFEASECIKNGVIVKNGYYPAKDIKDFYDRSQQVIIPAVHGSERTVLESMSMDIKPIVTHKENIKTYSYIQELEESGLTPREFVLKNYSHTLYAENIMKGILG